MNLDKAIRSRKSVRKFHMKKPDWRDILECIDVMRYAPMAANNFPLKFILVDDKDKIHKIADSSQQDFIKDAHYALVVFSNPSRIVNSFGEQGKVYLRQQAGAAIQNFLLKIEEKNLATCWVGHFVEEQIKNILKIPQNSTVEAILPIGYAGEKTKKREKIDLDSVLYFNDSKNKKMKKNRTVDA